jgi:hypothetical protein
VRRLELLSNPRSLIRDSLVYVITLNQFMRKSRGNSVSIVLRTGRPGDRGSIPGRGKRIFRKKIFLCPVVVHRSPSTGFGDIALPDDEAIAPKPVEGEQSNKEVCCS